MPHLNKQTRGREKGIERDRKRMGRGYRETQIIWPVHICYIRHFTEDNNSSLRKVVFKIFMYVEGLEDSYTT